MSRARAVVRRVVNVVLPALAGLFMASLVEGAPDRPTGALLALGMVAGAASGLALYWRHRYPRSVTTAVVLTGAVVQLAAPYGLVPYSGLIALWSLTTRQPLRVTGPALVALLGVVALSWPSQASEDVVFGLAVVVAVWALAEATRSRRAAIEQAARRAAAQEQARLSRDLHDVIAHSVSVIVVQAAAADDVFEQRPDQARAALRSIESTGRGALSELRRLLAATAPSPDLDRLDDLAAPLRAAGLTVDIRRGDGRPVPAGIGASAYRIVQEALTNAVRHAGAARVAVDVRSVGDTLEVDVTDDGRGPPMVSDSGRTGADAGRGIPGMRERAALVGGTVEAGPCPGGGFRVRARLPVRP